MTKETNETPTTPRRQETAVCSKEAVKALAKTRPHTIRRLFMSEDTVKGFGELCTFLAREHKFYRIAREDELEKLSGTVHHQGVVAMIEDTKLQPLGNASSVKKDGKAILLDDIGDDHNIGAIARTAAFFGFDTMILTGSKSKLTPGMYRVARGGLEYISVYYAESAADAIKACPHRLKFAADAHEGVPLKSLFAKNGVKAETRQSSDRRPSRAPDRREDRGKSGGCLLVLGNEERGLSSQVLKACPDRVKIHGSSVIESLNVVQAATILMYELSEHLKA